VTSATTSFYASFIDGMSSEAPSAISPVATLTQRLAAGDEASFAEFHVAYAARLFRYLIVLQRGDAQAADELLQDTLIRVVRHARSFEDEATLWSWLTRLARTAAADRARKTTRYLRFLERFQFSAAAVEEPSQLEADDIEQALEAALMQMPAEDAALLRAKYHQQATQRELAARFEISEAALESRLRRARDTLRQLAFEILQHRQQP
jgi:RNA polymerase sigma-70 factor, ECF subfamily